MAPILTPRDLLWDVHTLKFPGHNEVELKGDFIDLFRDHHQISLLGCVIICEEIYCKWDTFIHL